MDHTDRNRLKEVHQSDLTEGRINEDFLEWLKTKGMSWLLAILIGLCAYFGIVRWRHHRTSYQTEAWTSLADAKLPSSLEDVADKYSDVGAVPQLARLQAANHLLTAVQTGKTLGAETETQKDLADEDKIDYLKRADRLYAKVLEADDGSLPKTLVMVTALTGRAAVAESNGEPAKAKEFYTQAAQRAEGSYPQLAQQARQRADDVDDYAQLVQLPTQADLTALFQQRKTPPQLEPANMEPWASDLVLPKE